MGNKAIGAAFILASGWMMWSHLNLFGFDDQLVVEETNPLSNHGLVKLAFYLNRQCTTKILM